MANGMAWFRSIHGAPTHRKWLSVSRRSGQPVAVVVATVWALMDYASRHEDRGSLKNFDADDLAAFLGLEEEDVDAVIVALQHKGWLTDEWRIASWDEHQVKREDGAAERAKAWRESKKAEAERTRTQPNARERQEVEVEGDVDKKEEDPNGSLSPAVPSDPCPFAEIVAEWNGIAGTVGLPTVRKANEPRRRAIRARWNDEWQRSMQEVRDHFTRISEVPFCIGENDRGWRADLDYACKPKSFEQVRGWHQARGSPRGQSLNLAQRMFLDSQGTPH